MVELYHSSLRIHVCLQKRKLSFFFLVFEGLKKQQRQWLVVFLRRIPSFFHFRPTRLTFSSLIQGFSWARGKKHIVLKRISSTTGSKQSLTWAQTSSDRYYVERKFAELKWIVIEGGFRGEPLEKEDREPDKKNRGKGLNKNSKIK